MFKKIAASVLLGMSGLGAAHAADMNWTGFYAGANAGYLWSEASDFSGFGLVNQSVSPRGAFGGLHAGYDHQFPSNWVLGARVSVPLLSDVKGDTVSGALSTISYEGKMRWAALATVQLGYAMGRYLPYIGAGLVFAGGKATVNNFIPGTGPTPGAQVSDSQTHTGGTFLAGLRYALSDKWLLGVQYNYIDAGSETYRIGTASRDIGFKSNSLSVLLSYKF